MTSRILLPGVLAGLLAATLPAQEASLASELPAETLVYFEIADLQGFIESGKTSALGRIYRDPAVQDFAGGLLGMLREGWTGVRAQAGGLGVPPDLLQWDALTSLEGGLALGPGTVVNGEHQVAVCMGFALGLRGDLAQRTFSFLSQMAVNTGKGELVEGPDGPMLAIKYEDEEQLEIRARGGRIVGWSKIGDFGAGTLASSPQFSAAHREMIGSGNVVFGYVNLQGALTSVGNIVRAHHAQAGELVQRVFTQSGVSSIAYLAGVSGWRDGVSYSRAVLQLQPGVTPPLFRPDGPVVDPALLQYVPDNAVAFSLFVSDLDHYPDAIHGIWTELKQLEVQPGQPLGSMWEGFQPGHPVYDWMEGGKRELLDKGLKGLGEQGFSYSLPSAGGMMGGPAGGGAFLHLDDPAAVRDLLAQLVPEVAQLVNASKQIPVEIEIKTVKLTEKTPDGQTVSKDGPQYYALKLQGNELPPDMRQLSMFLGQIQPTLGVSPDGWLVVGMSRVSVSNILRKGLTAAESPITAKEDVKAFVGRVPKNACAVSWSDSRPGVAQMVALVQGFAPMITANLPPGMLPVDFAKFPPPESFVQHLRPTESYSVVEGSRMATHSVGSLDTADLFLGAGAVLSVAPPVMFQFMGRRAAQAESEHAEEEGAAVDEAQAQEPLPPPEDKPHGSSSASSVSSDGVQVRSATEELNRLITGIEIYKSEFQRCPGTLSELTKTTDNWPFGFLPDAKKGIVPDPWGNAYVYKLAGAGYALYSTGPDGVDDGGQGDDVRRAE